MSSKELFSNQSVKANNKVKGKAYKATVVAAANAVNSAGGVAYARSDKAALAQLAMTGCFNGTFYVSATEQLNNVLALAAKVDTEYLAKLAVYSRKKGLMKDMPALLAALVASRDSNLFKTIFPSVIDNPKMLRNFVQIIRSGVTGRTSLGTLPKKLIQQYLESLTDEQLFKADVGNDPSLQDIIKLVHPKPSNQNRSAMYGYLLDKEYNAEHLSSLAKDFEAFKKDMSLQIPDVPFQMLTALPLTDDHWKTIAKNATWNQSRMNLNTFARHNVFNDKELTKFVSDKLSDPEQVKRAKIFPYQLFSAYLNIGSDMPASISKALQTASEYSLQNIPEFEGQVYVMVDTSGSMSSPATGYRAGATTKMTCIDVASLFASAIMRKNPNTKIIPFDTRVHEISFKPEASMMENAKVLSSFGGGGTDCACALRHLNNKSAKGDLIIYVSDNASWMSNGYSYHSGTGMANEWNTFKTRNPKAKLVCLDITPSSTTQINNQVDTLNIGGFNDTVFDVIYRFNEMGSDVDLWTSTIETFQI